MSLRLEEAFAQGLLVRPNHREPGLVHLVQAIAHLTGVPGIDLPPPGRMLADLIGPTDHLIFILLDGLGMNTVGRLPENSFIASHLRRELQATCPSTTACALTTVGTAAFPNQHGIAGWFTYLPERSLTAVVLPFKDRATNQPLVERGIKPNEVVPLPPILPRMTYRALTITPSNITNTTYNYFSRGGTRGVGYESIPGAIDRIIEEIRTAGGKTYTHLYLPEIDTICHHIGLDHPDVVPQVIRIDAELARLADAVGGRARIVVSADHGLIDVPAGDQSFLLPGDPLLEMLRVPPTGDARMPVFHVRERLRDAFAGQFLSRFGDRM
ncbi:MAG TPA: alkaline phosphatase family protein, partial [Tepidisphaeraceae bacterium]|nr:alkaline phosphatase family protein [Tepidisphaeraceae bacterium]